MTLKIQKLKKASNHKMSENKPSPNMPTDSKTTFRIFKTQKTKLKKDKTAVVICKGKFPIQLRELYMFVDTIGSVYMKNIYPAYSFFEIGYLLNLYIYWSYGRSFCMYYMSYLCPFLVVVEITLAQITVLAIFHFP